MKSDRRRLKAEKFDLLNQMKQLYATLEDKEKELRDFIRNYEQVTTTLCTRPVPDASTPRIVSAGEGERDLPTAALHGKGGAREGEMESAATRKR